MDWCVTFFVVIYTADKLLNKKLTNLMIIKTGLSNQST